MIATILFIDTLLMGYIIGLIQDLNDKDKLILKGIEALVKDKGIKES